MKKKEGNPTILKSISHKTSYLVTSQKEKLHISVKKSALKKARKKEARKFTKNQ